MEGGLKWRGFQREEGPTSFKVEKSSQVDRDRPRRLCGRRPQSFSGVLKSFSPFLKSPSSQVDRVPKWGGGLKWRGFYSGEGSTSSTMRSKDCLHFVFRSDVCTWKRLVGCQTILKLTCLACGTNSSTYRWKRARAPLTSAPR